MAEIKIGLRSADGARNVASFDPVAQKWRRQSGEYLVWKATGLDGKLSTSFVKKWRARIAPGHRLLLGAIQKPLPGTPKIYGHGVDGDDHFYFMENLEDYQLLEDLIVKGHVGRILNALTALLVTHDGGNRIVAAAAALFEEANRRGFVYPDFSQKNIMIGLPEMDCRLIDLDSAFEAQHLTDRSGSSGEFSATFWGVWREFALNKTPETLSQTMVLAFSAVWARATAMLRAGCSLVDVQTTLRNPNYATQQAPFWKALAAGDRPAFQRFLLLEDDAAVSSAFGRWLEIFKSLRAGDAIPWRTIVAASENIFEVARRSNVVSAPQPLTPPPASADAFEAFIADPLLGVMVGPNFEKFAEKWAKAYSKTRNLEKMHFGYSWYTFLFGPIYMLYRKLYSGVAIWVGVELIMMLITKGLGLDYFNVPPLGGLVCAFFVNGMYFAEVRGKVEKTKRKTPDASAQLVIAAKTGGTSWVAAILGTVFAVGLLAVVDAATTGV